MLTDYHVHLRPDDLGATAAAHFTAENVDHYLARAAEAGVAELGISEHVYRFSDALGIWDHELWRENAIDDLGAYCEFIASTPLKLGIEMDFIPGAEDRIASLLDSHQFDYVIGSIHFVGAGAVDYDRFDVWRDATDPDELWARYFETLAGAASSGLFDILGHPDLIKYWGDDRPQPERDPRFHYEPAIEAIAAAGVAVEVSTAGLRKPVGELYPSTVFAEMCVEAGAAFSLASDAHLPADVGRDYETAVRRMRSWGIAEVSVFERRERRMEPLG